MTKPSKPSSSDRSFLDWTISSETPDPCLHPVINISTRNKLIYIRIDARHRIDIDHYFELNLATKKCKSAIKAPGIINVIDHHHITKTMHSNLGFNQFGELYLLQKNDKWFKTKIPLPNNSTLINFGYLVNQNNVIIFGGFKKNNFCDEIWIFKRDDKKWHKSQCVLPKPLGYITCQLIPVLSYDYDTSILYILSYWVRKLFPVNILTSRDVLDLVVKYFPNWIVYVFGGMTVNKTGNHTIYSIPLGILLQNSKEFKDNVNEKDISSSKCEFYDITNNTMPHNVTMW